MKKLFKTGYLLLSIVVVILGVSACGSNTDAKSIAPLSSASESDTNISSESAAKQLSAEEIANELKEAGLPIDNIIVYTEDDDPNELLGRPNQYISKVNFADTTVEQGNDEGNPVGGSVETFNNADDLNARKEYCEQISKKISAFSQYYYVNGNYLLRIDHDVTPSNAKKYESAFAELK